MITIILLVSSDLIISKTTSALLQYINITLTLYIYIYIYICMYIINKSCVNEHIDRYSVHVLTSDCKVAGRDAVDIDRDLTLCPH